jgi:Zn-finger protein
LSYSHFINFTCEFLPCHDLEGWHSCLFCYCPLFLLSCPGDFGVLPSGMKDCTRCVIPHTEEGWAVVQAELNRQLYSQAARPISLL